jgi:hypothetical protein
MDAKAPLHQVEAWLEANPARTMTEAARLHGWVPDSLQKALRRKARRGSAVADTGPDTPDMPDTVADTRPAPARSRPAPLPAAPLSDEFKVLGRQAIRVQLEALLNPAVPPGEAVQRAKALSILVDKFGGLMRVEKDDDGDDQAAETDTLAGYLPVAPPEPPEPSGEAS